MVVPTPPQAHHSGRRRLVGEVERGSGRGGTGPPPPPPASSSDHRRATTGVLPLRQRADPQANAAAATAGRDATQTFAAVGGDRSSVKVAASTQAAAAPPRRRARDAAAQLFGLRMPYTELAGASRCDAPP
jgi:hypothetical protein